MTTVTSTKSKASKGPKAPQKPDLSIHKKNLAVIDNEINQLKEKLNSVSSEINSLDKGKKKDKDPRTELRKRLAELREEQSKLKNIRQSKLSEINDLQTSIKKKIADIKALQSKTNFRSLAELEEYIEKQERKVESGKLKVIEEKKILNEISQLKKGKKSFDTILDLEDSLEEDRQKLEAIRTQIDDARSKSISNEYDEIKTKLDQLNLTGDEERSKRNKFFEKRDALRKQIDEQYEKRRALIEEHKQANDDFYTWKREEAKRREQLNEVRRKEEEREQVEALIKEELALAEIPAFENEIAQCGTLISYFQRISGNSEGTPKSETKVDGKVEASTGTPSVRQIDASNAPQGQALVKKADRDDVFFMGSKPKKTVKKPSNKSTSKTPGKATLTLPLSIMDALATLKLPIPTQAAAVPELIQAIQSKAAAFQANQAKANQEKRLRAQAKAKALRIKHGLEPTELKPENGVSEIHEETQADANGNGDVQASTNETA